MVLEFGRKDVAGVCGCKTAYKVNNCVEADTFKPFLGTGSVGEVRGCGWTKGFDCWGGAFPVCEFGMTCRRGEPEMSELCL
jgi:hypothetical protein